jgi:cytochrome c biogenesis protein CcdA
MQPLALALAFAAGLLTALSPCVLPLLPLVMGGAGGGRYGPAAIAAGFVAAFTAIGVAMATIGAALGVSDAVVRGGSAALLLAAGGAMLIGRWLPDVAGRWLSPVASLSDRLAPRGDRGLAAQFVVGALLGGIWSPCVGPTLGAALALAARGETLVRAAAIMAAFGLGSATVLLAAGYASRVVGGRRLRLLQAGAAGRLVFGALLVAIGLSVATGLDKTLEAAMVARLPQWWIDLLAAA